MEKPTSSTARIVAAASLVVAVLAVVVAVAGSGGGGSSETSSHSQQRPQRQVSRTQTTAKFYVVKTGDTLTAIAHRTGVPVPEILALNPEVDPQILIAGQKLKLR